MPSHLGDGPFLSLRTDPHCSFSNSNGRSNGAATGGSASRPFSTLVSNSASPRVSHSNGAPSTERVVPAFSSLSGGSRAQGVSSPLGNNSFNINDEFLKLDRPQQDMLLLHGPRKRYSLESQQDIPELRSDREILIQVLAIGLNPVDWKGADFNFGQPQYPWVNGRDFAGIVIRGPAATDSRIQTGDVVFGPSTDYRDIRKAAYQEYLVTTDYNVARITPDLSVKAAAVIGVAYSAAAIALGVSFGLDFSTIEPKGPDLWDLVRRVGEGGLPGDVASECLESIEASERPVAGEWLAIWGASSTTAMIALQLAKRAGLKVVCVADVEKTGSRLYELGADILVDRQDPQRALSIIRSVTGGKLRFGLDTVGKDTTTLLQEILAPVNGKRAHLLGLTGLPKDRKPGIQYHNVPIKIFHDVPVIGEVLMAWMENLTLTKTFQAPEIEVAEGGLAGVNDALDRLRSGQVSGKRIVVPVGQEKSSPANGYANGYSNGQTNGSVASGKIVPPPMPDLDEDESYLKYADVLNSDPERIKFAYWVPNVSGGLVISKIPQKTSWDYKANRRYGKIAETFGFEYALSQIRFMAGYGADNQHESVSISHAILGATKRLKVIAALLPGPWNPAVAAKQLASIDNYTDGRIAVNVVFGWFKLEFTSIGQWWLDHAERYRRGREFIECLRGIWTQESFTYKGDFYQFNNYPMKPKPISSESRPHPEIFQGGNSHDARDNAAHASDWYFMNGNTLDGFRDQIEDVKERAVKAGRPGKVGFAANSFVICRDTEEEAIQVLRDIQGKADADAVEGFRQQVQNAGASSSTKTGMWANSSMKDLVSYNDGFKTKLIGTPQQIAERIMLLKSLGIKIILMAVLHYEEEIQLLGEKVIPLVRQMEKEGRGTDPDYEISLNGWVYDTPQEGT